MTEESKQIAYVARQAIFNKKMSVMGYELLFREGKDKNVVKITDGTMATTQLLSNVFRKFGLDKLVGKNKAFINITRELLWCCNALPKDRVVIELLEDLIVEPEVLVVVKSLCMQGYTIALDDFQYTDKIAPLLNMVHIIKLDVQALSFDQIIQQIKILSAYPVKLLAEKIETLAELNFCKSVGFELFQGYFLSKPYILKN